MKNKIIKEKTFTDKTVCRYFQQYHWYNVSNDYMGTCKLGLNDNYCENLIMMTCKHYKKRRVIRMTQQEFLKKWMQKYNKSFTKFCKDFEHEDKITDVILNDLLERMVNCSVNEKDFEMLTGLIEKFFEGYDIYIEIKSQMRMTKDKKFYNRFGYRNSREVSQDWENPYPYKTKLEAQLLGFLGAAEYLEKEMQNNGQTTKTKKGE